MSEQWFHSAAKGSNQAFEDRATARDAQLTKPPGALGQLERVAIRLAALQAQERPSVDKVWISVFAGDHGIAAEGVSAFPQEVTQMMLGNFIQGGAAISVLAKGLGADLEVVNVGAITPSEEGSGVVNAWIAAGTANFSREDAMSSEQVLEALQVGKEAAERAEVNGSQLFIAGEMGIANTSASTALGCVMLECAAVDMVGPGTGINQDAVQHKAEVIQRGLDRQPLSASDPLMALAAVGGLEITAMAGSYIRSAQLAIPVLLDGFISCSAALVARAINPSIAPWLLLSHRSAEPGHKRMIDALGGDALLDLKMRLGEGSGAAVAVNLLRSACLLHNEMATFAEAGVAEKSD